MARGGLYGIEQETMASRQGRMIPRPILMFHSVSTPTARGEARFNISPGRFWRTMDLFSILGFSSGTDLDATARDQRDAIITFDDGYEDVYTEVFPKFVERGLNAVVFVVVGQLSGTNSWDPTFTARRLLSGRQIREMHRYGFQFGSHSMTHQSLPSLDPVRLRNEIVSSKARLEDLLGSEVASFSYPFGLVTPDVRAVVRESGYHAAVGIKHCLSSSEDLFCLDRISFCDSDGDLDVLLKLLTGREKKYSLRMILGGLRPILNRSKRSG